MKPVHFAQIYILYISFDSNSKIEMSRGWGLIKSDEMGFFAFTKYPYSSQTLFSLLLCLSQHKLKFWTGIRQKIRCGMVSVGMDP